MSSLNNKLNSPADAIKTHEGKMSLLAAQLEPRMTTKYDGGQLRVVTHSIKITIMDVSGNEEN